MSTPDTSGERRTLSDHADVILNDTDDGVSIVIENRDKHPYVLDFNFSQTQNMTLELATAGTSAKLTDVMKVSMEVPAGAAQTLGDFHLIDDNVTSLIISYRVRCRIRNMATGKIEKCPTARNQELDVPEVRTAITSSVDLVAKQAPSGYVCYLENKSGSAISVAVDFGSSVNAEVNPLDTRVKQSSAHLASITIPANGTVEFVEVGPAARGPFKFDAKAAATQPSAATVSAKDIPKTVSATMTASSPSSSSSAAPLAAPAAAAPAAKPVAAANADDGFEQHGGGAGSGGYNQHGGGSGGFGSGSGGAGSGPSGAGSQAGGGSGGFNQHGGGSGGFGSGSGGAGSGSGASTAPAPQPAAPVVPADAGPDVSAFGAGGTDAGQNQFVNDKYLLENFPTIHKYFGFKGKMDASPNSKNWTAYRWVLKYWEDERIARMKLEAEWKIRYSMYIKQWHESVCNICRRLLVEGTATEIVQYKEYRLHKICYERADKCHVCSEILVGEYVIAKGTDGQSATKLHTACIDAYRKRSRPSCSICKTQIMDDKWGTANGQPFHFGCKK